MQRKVHKEIFILPDQKGELDILVAPICPIHIIPTGKKLPSHKRDIALRKAQGKYIVFIDADAYPVSRDWLMNAREVLESGYTGVCGPGLLPPDAPIREQYADDVLWQLPYGYRVRRETKRLVTDFPTFNLILRRRAVVKAGGFNCDFLTGEDTRLCDKITKQGGEIMYDPDLAVYHHRRPVILPFLKQIAVYARHRGYFFRQYPRTSRKLIYALPSVGLICAATFMLLLLWYCLR